MPPQIATSTLPHWYVRHRHQGAFLNKFYRRMLRAMRHKPKPCRNQRPIVSFTFDDFPSSAIREGGPILRRYDAHGTYYVAMGHMRGDDDPDDGLTFTAADLREVVAQGHELACHTSGHMDCGLTTPEMLELDIKRNAALLQQLVPGYEMTNFAYPYGNLSLQSKRLMSSRFVSARGIWTGINAGQADLSLLRAHPIYGEEANYQRALELIRRNERVNGWLIFFTHDVRANPTRFGSTPADLERIVRAARESRCEILTIRDALAEVAPDASESVVNVGV